MMGHVYHKLVKNGLPISFVTSTHALKAWRGTAPLVVVDGYDLLPAEFDDLERLNAVGAPIVAVAPSTRRPRAPARTASTACASATAPARPRLRAPRGPRVHQACFVRRVAGGAPIVFAPVPGRSLAGRAAAKLVETVLAELGSPLAMSPA